MRKILLVLILVPLLTLSAIATEGIDTEILEEGLPEEAGELMPEISPKEQGDFWSSAREVFLSALGKTESSLKAGLRLCAMLLGISTLCSMVSLSVRGKYSGAAGISGALGLTAAVIGTLEAMVGLASDTVGQLSDYNTCMLPVLASAAAMSGGFTASAALYAGTMLFTQILMQLISKLLIPAVFFFLAICAAEAALNSETLSELREFVGWLISKSLRIMLYLFLAYMSITGVVSGAVDAAALKATKATLSGMVPVVGGIISDASESLLAGASILKGSVGVFGMVAILAICLLPFLRIGVQYLLMKITAAVSGTVALPNHVKLLKNFSAAMGYLLAMCGTCGFLLLISNVCFLKVVV